MCGRFGYVFADPVRAWYEAYFGPPDPNDLAARDRYNIAPTQSITVVSQGAGGLVASEATWGVPGPGGKPVFNARSETAATSPLWAPLWGRSPCVVPASGFYEWTGRGAGRTPFWITRTDDAPLLFAGLLAGPRDASAATILTCVPNRFMAGLHDRMPVVLEPEQVEPWLAAAPGWEELAVPAPEVLDGHAVGKAVGDGRAEGSQLIEPVRAWF